MQLVVNLNPHALKYYLLHYLKANRGGHGIHSPFVYSLCEEVFYNKAEFYQFKMLLDLRSELLHTTKLIEVEDFGAGSKILKNKKRSVAGITKHGISSVKQSRILFHLIHFLNCNTNIELGTSIGLNTLYMAEANKKARVFSLEGSGNLIDFARNLALKVGSENIHWIPGHFDHTLPALMDELNSYDLAYADGNHTYSASIHYFETLLKKKHAKSVIIFDDIYWSPGMTKAWNEIRLNPEVTLSLDAFYFGMVFFREEIKEKQHFRIFI